MDLITARHIKKNYSEKQLLEDINLIIHENDKIGLVGVNGSGKSTLLKIIAGAMEAEGGEISRSPELRMGYLPQNPEFNPELTIEEQMKSYLETSGQMDNIDDYVYKAKLSKMGINDLNEKMGNLSGGQRKKVAIAAVLSGDKNLLILDEPTNHMDGDIVEWLENELDEFKGAILIITHDRYFLERVTDIICEIDKGKLVLYEGNYDYYLETKAQRLSMAIASERKRAAIYKKELKWIHWSAPARTTKARGRIDRFKKLEAAKQSFENPELEISSLSSRLGKKIIEISDLSKAYGEKVLFKDFSYNILRNDRIAIVGPNGCGKTTLLKILAGKETADSGGVDIGETVKIGYFSQEAENLDPNQRLIKFVEDIAYGVQTKDGYVSASQMLEKFLFPLYMHSTMVGRLSGGEKRRLALLAVLLRAPNVLLFDEPTNDLDIETLTILEDYLDDFAGAVVIVSHDRYFVDRLAIKTFAFENDGEINQYTGGYSKYMNERDAREEAKAVQAKANSSKVQASSGTSRNTKLKFSYNEQREFNEIESVIESIENEISRLEAEIAENSDNYPKLMELSAEKEKKEELLLEKMDRWEYLSELNEKITNQ